MIDINSSHNMANIPDEKPVTNDIPLSPDDMKGINNLLKAISKNEKQDRKEFKQFRDKEKLCNALHALMGEYLNAYLIIGFTPDGNELITASATTKMENIALNALMERFFEQMMIGNHVQHEDDMM